MVQRKSESNRGTLAKAVVLSLLGLAVLFAVLMYGKDIALFNPKGLIASEQARLMTTIIVVFLAAAVPALFFLYFFAWKYRETNAAVKRQPSSGKRRFSSFSLWVVPCLVLVITASIMWPATHQLDPHKAISATNKPLKVQVIAMQWKWLFIYPEQNIATVNFVQLPVDTPIQFDLSADEAPMNSFWIPHLGGQLYAMTGHSNPLNLMADTPGDYPGQAAEINGEGFAHMKFTTRVSSQQDFDSWVKEVRGKANPLNQASYQALLKPSEANPVALYSSTPNDLYGTVLAKYSGSHGGHHGGAE